MGLIDYETHISEVLQDPEVLQEYLNQALQEDDERVLLIVLRDIIKAKKGGLAQFAKETGYSRQTLYKTLSPKGNPTWSSLHTFLNAAGFNLKVEVVKKPKGKKRPVKRKAVPA